MKPAFHLLGIAVALICVLAGCGQKGPLYLPAKPQPVAATPAAQPAPASTGSTSDSK